MDDDDNGTRRRQVEANLTTLYGPQETQEKTDHRNRIVSEDGQINGFQESGLSGAVRRLGEEAVERPAANPPVAAGPPPLPEELAIDVPEPEQGYTDRFDLVGAIKGALGIEGAVRRFGKPQPGFKTGSKTEGIHVRCPFPHHPDNNPSAWINTVKGTWFCGGCQIGGDQLDWYAAAVHGLSPDEFHGKGQFQPILIEMAEALGIDPDPPMSPPPPPPAPDPVPPAPSAPPAPPPVVARVEPDEPLTVEQTTAGIDMDNLAWDAKDSGDPLAPPSETPSFNWRALKPPPGTFLHELMVQAEKDHGDIPEEYMLMLGFLALGLACGHHQYSEARGHTTIGSMTVILIGPSGAGKSTAIRQFTKMFKKCLGSRWDWERGTGVRQVRTPGSGEALIRDIYYEIEDFADPSKMVQVPVTAFWIENEFATLLAKMSRPGSTLRPNMIDLFDFAKEVDDPEDVLLNSSLTNGKMILKDSFVSAAFTTQTDVVRSQFTDEDAASGLLGRFWPVFGKPRRRKSQYDTVDPDPEYVPIFAKLWDRLRNPSLPMRRILRVSEDAKAMLEASSYMKYLYDVEQRDGMSLLARMAQHVNEIAFLLAVNEDAREVGKEHHGLALNFVQTYLQPCYASLNAATKATKTKDLATNILEWVHVYFEQNGEWPQWWQMTNQRFWTNANEHEREISVKGLTASHHLATVKLKGLRGRPPTIVIATDRDGYWKTEYAGAQDKVITKEDLYGRA